MELSQFNTISNVLNTQFPDFLPYIVFGLVARILTILSRRLLGKIWCKAKYEVEPL